MMTSINTNILSYTTHIQYTATQSHILHKMLTAQHCIKYITPFSFMLSAFDGNGAISRTGIALQPKL